VEMVEYSKDRARFNTSLHKVYHRTDMIDVDDASGQNRKQTNTVTVSRRNENRIIY
jgi:hypothetical protein